MSLSIDDPLKSMSTIPSKQGLGATDKRKIEKCVAIFINDSAAAAFRDAATRKRLIVDGVADVALVLGYREETTELLDSFKDFIRKFSFA